MREFCPYCGAGNGRFRRANEGICDRCNVLYTPSEQTIADGGRPIFALGQHIFEHAYRDYIGHGYMTTDADAMYELAQELARISTKEEGVN